MRSGIALAAMVASIPLWIALASPHSLQTHDQARQAMYVIDVMEGHWWLPRDRGEIATKPPLYAWIAALVAWPWGAGEVTVRLPSMLSSIGLGVILFGLGRRVGGTGVGALAVLLMATTEHVTKLAFLARTDMLLAFWAAVALWAAHEGRWRTYWTAVGLATLTKGPVGFAIPVLGVALHAAFERDRRAWTRLRPLRGSILALAIVGLWFVPAVWIDGAEIWRVMIRQELVDRIAGVGSRAYSERHAFGYLSPYLLGKLFPASLLLPLVLVRPKSAGIPSSLRNELGGWLLAGLVVVSLPRSARADYLLPIYAPAWILLAFPLDAWRRGGGGEGLRRALHLGTRIWAIGLGVVVAGVGVALAAGWVETGTPFPMWARIVPALAIVPVAVAARRSGPRRLLGAALAAQILAVLLFVQGFTTAAREGDGPGLRAFAQAIREQVDPARVEFHRAHSRALQFLLGRNVPERSENELEERVRQGEELWVVVAGSVWDALLTDEHRFRAWGSPELLLRGATRRHRDGDDLVLVRIPARRLDQGAPLPRR